MTRETKLGLIVAGAFLALMGGVIGVKSIFHGPAPAPTSEPTAAAQAPPPAIPEPEKPAAPVRPAEPRISPSGDETSIRVVAAPKLEIHPDPAREEHPFHAPTVRIAAPHAGEDPSLKIREEEPHSLPRLDATIPSAPLIPVAAETGGEPVIPKDPAPTPMKEEAHKLEPPPLDVPVPPSHDPKIPAPPTHEPKSPAPPAHEPKSPAPLAHEPKSPERMPPALAPALEPEFTPIKPVPDPAAPVSPPLPPLSAPPAKLNSEPEPLAIPAAPPLSPAPKKHQELQPVEGASRDVTPSPASLTIRPVPTKSVEPPSPVDIPFTTPKADLIPPAGIKAPEAAPKETVPARVESKPAEDNYVEDLYQIRNGETFATISKAHYLSDTYATALSNYNKANPGGQADYIRIPPVWVLEKRYPNDISNVRAHFAPPPSAAPPAAAPENVYIVAVNGEFLADIAQKTLGNEDAWTRIKELNRNINEVKRIPAGTRLVLPPK